MNENMQSSNSHHLGRQTLQVLSRTDRTIPQISADKPSGREDGQDTFDQRCSTLERLTKIARMILDLENLIGFPVRGRGPIDLIKLTFSQIATAASGWSTMRLRSHELVDQILRLAKVSVGIEEIGLDVTELHAVLEVMINKYGRLSSNKGGAWRSSNLSPLHDLESKVPGHLRHKLLEMIAEPEQEIQKGYPHIKKLDSSKKKTSFSVRHSYSESPVREQASRLNSVEAWKDDEPEELILPTIHTLVKHNRMINKEDPKLEAAISLLRDDNAALEESVTEPKASNTRQEPTNTLTAPVMQTLRNRGDRQSNRETAGRIKLATDGMRRATDKLVGAVEDLQKRFDRNPFPQIMAASIASESPWSQSYNDKHVRLVDRVSVQGIPKSEDVAKRLKPGDASANTPGDLEDDGSVASKLPSNSVNSIIHVRNATSPPLTYLSDERILQILQREAKAYWDSDAGGAQDPDDFTKAQLYGAYVLEPRLALKDEDLNSDNTAATENIFLKLCEAEKIAKLVSIRRESQLLSNRSTKPALADRGADATATCDAYFAATHDTDTSIDRSDQNIIKSDNLITAPVSSDSQDDSSKLTNDLETLGGNNQYRAPFQASFTHTFDTPTETRIPTSFNQPTMQYIPAESMAANLPNAGAMLGPRPDFYGPVGPALASEAPASNTYGRPDHPATNPWHVVAPDGRLDYNRPDLWNTNPYLQVSPLTGYYNENLPRQGSRMPWCGFPPIGMPSQACIGSPVPYRGFMYPPTTNTGILSTMPRVGQRMPSTYVCY